MKKLVFILLLLFLSTNLISEENNTNSQQIKKEEGYSQYYKKLKYEASLIYTKYNSKDVWWSHIAPFNLYLGAIPLKNEGHLEAISSLGVTRILSVVENFEMEDGWLNTPVKKEEWESLGIEVMQIEAIDFLPLTMEEIDSGVEYLSTMLANGEGVYVHCKAGRGRSATIVIAYLMKYQSLSFDEAYQFVYDVRPQINLNVEQRKAIYEYFGLDLPKEFSYLEYLSQSLYSFFVDVNKMSEEKLSLLLQSTLTYAIDGVASKEIIPDPWATWLPEMEIQSTLERRNRYLREFQGNQEKAVQVAIDRNHGLMRKFKIMAPGLIPIIGTPTSYSISLWHQLREITLIAALYGHDIKDNDVQLRILSCLAGGNALKVPAYSIDLIARQIVKKVTAKAGISQLSSVIPANLIFNYFTENSAHVASHAVSMFGQENTQPIPAEEYWILN